MVKKINISLKILATLTSVAGLSACESILTNKEIGKQYANHSINSFVKDRYTCPRFNKFSDQMQHITSYFKEEDALEWADPAYYHMEYLHYVDRILSDGKSVIYPAPFTVVNYRFLYKPIEEMLGFCTAKGGTLFIKERFDKDIQELPQSPRENYFKPPISYFPHPNITMRDMLHGRECRMNAPVNKHLIPYSAISKAIRYKTRPIYKIYEHARNQDAFGIYVCRHNTNGKPLWGVIIKPIAFYQGFCQKYPYDSLDMDVLLLLITPVSE